MAMQLLPSDALGYLPRVFGYRADEEDLEGQENERQLFLREKEWILEAFILEAQAVRPNDVRDRSSALALLERYADAYERDRRGSQAIERMRTFLRRPDVRRSPQLTEATRARLRMWGAAKRYAEWRDGLVR